MIEKILLLQGSGFDPYWNLAVEQHLLERTEPGCCILYLWQNQNTVVIGRNQNAWKECRTTLLEQEGGRLARRLSGGGAVFHDLGNLNYTFLVSTEDYDLDRQFSVILEACRGLGLQAERSGRNDVLAQGRKFSGNAFYRDGHHAYHHGTLLVDADMERMGRYLNPDKTKLAAKGVDSVRSRVVNLRELVPDLTIPVLKEHMARAFEKVYGLSIEEIFPEQLDRTAIDALCRRNQSWEWNYGRQLPFTFACEERFPWGGIQLQLQVESGLIRQAQVYSDAMDWQIVPALERSLIGCRFTLGDMEKRISALSLGQDICAGLLQMLTAQEI